ncbi:hypothetical protein HBN50_06325 [Halobacteriovorax sp. GB3]|uniref:hypothetical protein n=1 Tax=Halobacteriovorax sp. GB3 TaxID=2719615 RepID=UPI00235F12D2|nr:hypothetical protein [Halobacteriovorax sp. GB3]MDD0852703.1 hypothetical protein [Halobacteriovorax sp. GB3]
MKFTNILFISFLLCPIITWAQENSSSLKLVGKDRIVFRVDSKTYFVSEINQQLSSMQTFSCLKKSYLIKYLSNFGRSKSVNYAPVGHEIHDLRKREADLVKTLEVLKIQSFIKGRSVKVTSQILKELGLQSCYPKGADTMSALEKDLLFVEVFLRQRFNIKEGKNREDSLFRFLESISTKVTYDLFF